MAAKKLIFDQEARAALKRGADTLADAVKVTLGAARQECRNSKVVRIPCYY